MHHPRHLPLVLLSLALAAPSFAQEAPRRRSVLFYLIDTCRADRLSLHGNERETTPFIDRLAARGVVFERCYAQAPWTKPSVASMLTSRYAGEVGIYLLLQQLEDDFTTLPEAFQAAGYTTAGFSANPLVGAFSNYAQGFDHFVESILVNAGDPINFASGSAKKLNRVVLPSLEEQRAWPLFLYIHSVDPHEEYEPAPEYLELFADPAREELYRKEWRTLLASRPPVPGNHLTRDNFERTGIEPGPFIDYGLRLHDADLRANDFELERLWSALEENGWGDDVVLVVTSDHGEEFFEHGGTSHAYSLYDELLHVPFILYAPGLLPEGLRIDRPVRLLDIYPTLCELLEVEAPEGLSGRSLLPLIRGDEGWTDEPVMAEKTEDPGGRKAGSAMGIAMSRIEGNWKLILNLLSPDGRPMPRHELFDLAVDPGETRNLAAEDPERVARMDAALMEWSAANMGLVVADTVEMEAIDPALLEELRALGYLGDEEDVAGLPEIGARIPLLARAVLESARRWAVYALEPPTEGSERRFLGWKQRDRDSIRGEALEALRHLIYRGVLDGEEAATDRFDPRYGFRTSHEGHTVSLLVCYASRSIHVYLNGARVATVPTDAAVEPGIRALLAKSGLDVSER